MKMKKTNFHVGRSFHGTKLEDDCPCPKEKCGLVSLNNVLEECCEHNPIYAKTIRQGHTSEACAEAVFDYV